MENEEGSRKETNLSQDNYASAEKDHLLRLEVDQLSRGKKKKLAQDNCADTDKQSKVKIRFKQTSPIKKNRISW